MLTNWKTFKLIELYNISSGLSKSADEFGFGFPFLSFSTVFKNYFIPEELDQLVNTSIKEQNTCSIKKGDVFLTRTSEVIEELGMSCVALKDYPNATFNGFTKRLRPKNNQVVDPLFIGYYLRNVQFRAEISAYSTLTTRASLNNGIIEKLKVSIPPLPIQQKISSILSSYDELIENNKQRIKLLEEMAEEIYKEWFVRLRFPGYETTKIIDGLPDGWENGTIGDLVEFKKGKNITLNTVSEGNVPVVAGGLTPAYYHNVPNTISPTVTVSASGANAGFVNLYYEDIWASDCSFIDTKSTEILFFIYLTLKTRQNEVFFLQKGSAQPHVYPKDIMTLKMKKPSIDLIGKFEDLVVLFFEEIKILSQKINLLQETRDLLLPRLISGKLSVEHLVEEELLMAAEPRAEYKKQK
jgi:type I restriction enzyme S subunit